MKPTAAILKYRHAVWAFLIGVILFGFYSYFTLPIQLFPDTSPPVVNVITAYPGAAAEDVARDLSRVLEEEFSTLDGLVKVRSNSEDNLSLIMLEFEYARSAALAAMDVQNAVARQRGNLPGIIGEPQILTLDTSDRPVITLGVLAEDLLDARRLSEDSIAPEIQRLPGVAAVDVFGGSVEALLIEVDIQRASAYGIPLARVAEAIGRQYTAMPAGRIRTEREEMIFRIETRSPRPESLEELMIPTAGGTMQRLGDIATVRMGSLDDRAHFAIKGQQVIGLQVFQTEGSNTVEVVRRVEAYVEELNEQLEGVEILIGEESATFTETSIANLLSNIWEAVLLAAIVIFLFLARPGASLLTVISMPLSFGLTFVGMKVFGIEFNMVTLTAVILSVGMVVDASVVVLENIIRLRELGRPPLEAAVEGTDEVLGAVVAGVLTTVAVLIPLIFLPGFVGRTFGPLALILLISFLSSGLVALVIVPLLSLYIGEGKSRLDRLALRISAPFRSLMGGVQEIYLKILRLALSQRLLTLIIVFATLGLGMKGIQSRGMEVLPKMDMGSFYVSFETPSGTSLEETGRVAGAIEAILNDIPEVVLTQRQTGFEQGMRTFSATGAQGSTQGFITVELTPRTERERSVWQIQEAVHGALDRVPGIETLVVRELGNTAKSTTSAPIAVLISGKDLHILDRLGEEVIERLQDVEGLINPVRTWKLDRKRSRVEVDPLRAASLGLSPAEIGMQMQLGSQGLSAGRFYGKRDSPVPIQVLYRDRALPSDLLAYPVLVPTTGESIALRSLASHQPEVGTALVTRENLLETLEITAYNQDRPLSFVMASVQEALRELQLPAGYELTLAGERSDLEEARSQLGGALLLASFFVYLLLLVQLRSFVLPFIIMVSAPLSIIGVSLALQIAGRPVSMPVMVGLILLVGIVINNAIILIEFITQARAEGMSRREALLRSVEVRFRPIMMTSLSTIMGMIPLAAAWALGAERFAPLAIAVIGGMLASTLLTMVVIPVLYDLVDSVRHRPKTLSLLVFSLPLGFLATAPLDARAQQAPGPQPVRQITLEESIELALEHSPQLKERSHVIKQTELQMKEARAQLFARVELQGRYSRMSENEPGELHIDLPAMPEPVTMRLMDRIENFYFMRIQAEQPLFVGGALRRQVELAELAQQTQQAIEYLETHEIRALVEEAYLVLLLATKSLATIEQSIEVLESHHRRLLRLVEMGRATELEAGVARVRKLEARARQLRARAAVENMQRSLNQLMGLDLETPLTLSEAPIHREVPPPDEPIEQALRHRPEIGVLRLQKEVAEKQEQLTGASLWPQLFLSAGVTVARPHERYFPVRDEFNSSWDISLFLRWTAWDWGARRARQGQARQAIAISELRIQALEDRTRQEVHGRMREIQISREEVRVLGEAVASAEDALAQAERLFEAGRVTSAEVLERESELTQARQNEVEARVNVQLAELRLRRLLGGGPELSQ